MKKATVYTRKGDNGTTTIIGGKQLDKDHARIEAYGTIDELNAHIGFLAAAMDCADEVAFLEDIESRLFSIGSHLATAGKAGAPVSEADIRQIEEAMDTLEEKLPRIDSFLLPPNCEIGARANICRTICRRAERQIASIDAEYKSQEAMVYMNRLSDYFFLLQRALCDGKEKKWQKPCK